jgi:hypothetical protein
MKGFEMDPAALDTSGSSPGGGNRIFCIRDIVSKYAVIHGGGIEAEACWACGLCVRYIWRILS